MTKYVTIDGYDSEADLTVPVIFIWKDTTKPSQGVVAHAKHGTRVELLGRVGRKVKVKHGDAVGFVTFWFIREFKGEGLR